MLRIEVPTNEYEKLTTWIYNLKRFGDTKLRLKVIKSLLQRIGNPHKNLKVIHVGGTNGKGSTVSMIASILQSQGYKVGVFTKPHLTDYTERITINGKKIDESKVVELINNMKPYMGEIEKEYYHPTFFEVTVALMFKYFADEMVDFAVIEVGLGGRLDATNVTKPLVSIITNIGLEHTTPLGNTIKKIAMEKAGIIKKNGILLTAAKERDAIDVFRDVCKKKKSKFILVGNIQGADIRYKKLHAGIDGQEFTLYTTKGKLDLYTPLLGEHQMSNASLAVGSAEELGRYGIKISDDAIKEGLKKVKWPGRLEIMQKNPYVVLDCAKDTLATKELVRSIKSLFNYKQLIVVVSISSGKKVKEMMEDLVSMSDLIFITEHKVRNRAVKAQELAKEANAKPYEIVQDVKNAVKSALNKADKNDLILVTGSVFTVGEAREIWYKEVNFRWGREFNES